MKYRVKVDDQLYDVEVVDIFARPVIAIVDGEQIEVWPEANANLAIPEVSPVKEAVNTPKISRASPVAVVDRTSTGSSPGLPQASNVVRAPIPGNVLSISARPGARVSPGDELCVLEAMKMKNIIRAMRTGIIASIHVHPGQTVKHQDILMEYES
jgi:biotin carboxyl carrier protein